MPLYLGLVLDLTDPKGNPVTTGSVTLVPGAVLTDAPDMMTIPPVPVTEVLTTAGLAVAGPLLASDSPAVVPQGWAWNVWFAVPGEGIPTYPLFLPAGPAPFTAVAGSPAVLTWSPPGPQPWQLQSLPNGTGVQVDPFGPFAAGVTYYVVGASGDTVQLAASQGGPPIASDTSGSGWLAVAQYNLSALIPAEPVTELGAYMPQPTGTPAAGLLPFATGVGEASAWGAIGATDLPPSGVTPGSYADADITVDAYGRVTAASPGPGGDKTYTQAFSAGSTTIPVNHGLGKYPAVTVWDSAGDLVLVDVDFTDIDNLTLIFRSPFGGTVSCN